MLHLSCIRTAIDPLTAVLEMFLLPATAARVASGAIQSPGFAWHDSFPASCFLQHGSQLVRERVAPGLEQYEHPKVRLQSVWSRTAVQMQQTPGASAPCVRRSGIQPERIAKWNSAKQPVVI